MLLEFRAAGAGLLMSVVMASACTAATGRVARVVLPAGTPKDRFDLAAIPPGAPVALLEGKWSQAWEGLKDTEFLRATDSRRTRGWMSLRRSGSLRGKPAGCCATSSCAG